MKHIKKYNEKFKKGDYVLLDLEKMNEYDKEDIAAGGHYVNPPDSLAIITLVYPGEDELEYAVKFYNDEYTNIRKIEIIRKLMPEEIDKFKLKKLTNKYNL